EAQAFAESFLVRKNGENAFAIREELGKMMWTNVGIVRTGEKLKAGIQAIAAIRERTGNIAASGGREFNLGWQQALDISNMLTASDLIARSALHREDSRGAHFREDFPKTDNTNWLRNIYCVNDSGAVKMWTEPVKLSRLQP